jgi:hypothetical protein
MCFGTGLPSSGSHKNTKYHNFTCDTSCSFDSLKWRSGAETRRGVTYHESCFMICILLTIFVGQYAPLSDQALLKHDKNYFVSALSHVLLQLQNL